MDLGSSQFDIHPGIRVLKNGLSDELPFNTQLLFEHFAHVPLAKQKWLAASWSWGVQWQHSHPSKREPCRHARPGSPLPPRGSLSAPRLCQLLSQSSWFPVSPGPFPAPLIDGRAVLRLCGAHTGHGTQGNHLLVCCSPHGAGSPQACPAHSLQQGTRLGAAASLTHAHFPLWARIQDSWWRGSHPLFGQPTRF